MQNKNLNKIFFVSVFLIGFISINCFANQTDMDNSNTETVQQGDVIAQDESQNSVANYDVDGSLFQQITDLEQQKVLMKLTKEKAELDLDLDRLANEKVKLNMELDNLNKQKEDKDTVKSDITDDKSEDKSEDKNVSVDKPVDEATPVTTVNNNVTNDKSDIFNQKYKLINIIGSGDQLQSTIQDLSGGQQRKISVGKQIDGWTVESISLYDGVVFEQDGKKEILNIGIQK